MNFIYKLIRNPITYVVLLAYYFFFTESGKIMWAKLCLWFNNLLKGKIIPKPLSGNQNNTTSTIEESE